MTTTHHIDSLRHLLQSHQTQITELADYDVQLTEILQQEEPLQLKSLISLYDQVYPLVEKLLWNSDNFDSILELYQRLFREQDLLISHDERLSSNTRQRYDFILSIPIADRPEHLRGCLESIFQLCRLYSYGGKANGFFAKVTVIIVEDSKENKHVTKDIELAEEYNKKGLRVHHYGFREQYDLMLTIPENTRKDVSSIIGDPATENFYHKGQAVTRNLSYLKALQLTQNKDNTLYYLVDSDQQFRVNRTTADGDQYVYGLNYFYYINRLFNETDIAMLTGKLVCDPPVSPSVMTANFLDDVIAFLQQLSACKPQENCQFHPESKIKPDDAAYHDMAQLFGLKSRQQTYDYCCPIKTEHDHIACLTLFSARINYFFFGEHLTRKTYFTYSTALTDIVPARTIYPGNYITTFDGLKYIIPFGKLRLRMSGPTAGRLIQSEIKERFASVNLPMLHARTLQTDFSDEYRPGVEDNAENIDLSDEFERQFFGDLMLFTVDKLAKSGIAIEDYSQSILAEYFALVEQELLELYENKHINVKLKNNELSALVNDKSLWWNQSDSLTDSVNQLRQFIKSVDHNFDKNGKAYQQIQSSENRQVRIKQMIKALLSYRHDRNAWDSMLDQLIN